MKNPHDSAPDDGAPAAPGFRSATIRQGTVRATTRSFLHALGQDEDELTRPHVGVFHTGGEMSPCNMNLRDQAQHGWVTATPSTIRVTGSLSEQVSVSCWQVLSPASAAHWLSSRVAVTTFSPVTLVGVAPSTAGEQLT